MKEERGKEGECESKKIQKERERENEKHHKNGSIEQRSSQVSSRLAEWQAQLL